MFELIRTNADNADFRELVVMLDAELKVRDGEDHYFFAQFNKLAGILGVVLAYDGETAVGCGGFKEMSANEAEIKRMFVRPEYRGQRIAAKVLAELEMWAGESG